jgi:hypothetical protein
MLLSFHFNKDSFSENWIINKRDAQKLEAAEMRILRSLFGLKVWTARETLTSVTD